MARLLPMLVALGALGTPVLAQDDNKDPVVDGKKMSVWVTTLREDSSARQRSLAIQALSKVWTEKRIPSVIGEIGRALRVDSSVAVRVQAATSLGGLRETEVRYLISEQKSLGVEDMVKAMGAEKESRVRRELAKAIGRFPDVAKLAVAQLAGALKDPEPATRVALAEALTAAGSDAKSAASELAPLLADPDPGARKAAIMALGRIAPEGASAVAETMAKMLGTEKDAELRGELVTSLGLLGEKAPAVVTALGALLTLPDEELRRRAARVLGTFGTAAGPVAEVLLKAANTDAAKDIRVDALHAYGSALGPESLKRQLKDFLALLGDPEFEVRLAAVSEIASLGNELKDDKDTMKVLRARLSDPHPKVRDAVRMAITRIEKKPEPKKEPEPKKNP